MNNIFVYILTLFLFGSSNGLQQFFNTHNRQQFLTTMINDKGLGGVVSAVKNQLAEKLQEPFNDAAEELNSIIQIPTNIFDTMRENNTREYRTSDLPANVTSVLELFDNEDSVSATTGTTGMLLGVIVIVYTAVEFIYPIIKFLSIFLSIFFSIFLPEPIKLVLGLGLLTGNLGTLVSGIIALVHAAVAHLIYPISKFFFIFLSSFLSILLPEPIFDFFVNIF